ncbi:hypothetical protein BGP_6635 [Beggiatoa sp. PS]|nr:hypothetical protein BGP_6635 [Beggiatoa sp. PS]
MLLINLYNYNYIQFNKSLRLKISENPQKFKKNVTNIILPL